MDKTVTVCRRVLELARRTGVDYIFVTLGSDHPAFIEAFAQFGPDDLKIVVCPHEITALSAAHGYAMITRRPQMVLIHVDVGTANLGGSVHNAARSRIPVIIVAGLSPLTLNGELTASRTELIHYLQDTTHQADIVRPYVKWLYELRAAHSAESVFLRGYQIACTEPQGPIYLTGAREVWDMAGPVASEVAAQWPAAKLGELSQNAAKQIVDALKASKRPLIITSYYGRHPAAVTALVQLSERIAIGVCEIVPQAVNFPGSHPNHLGYNLGRHVDEADLILLLDIDVPWLPMNTSPAKGARIFHIDCDPLKPAMGLWHFPVEAVHQACSHMAVQQIAAQLCEVGEGRSERLAWLASARVPAEAPSRYGSLTSELVADTLRDLADRRTVFVLESPSATEPTSTHLRPDRPGSFFANGGTALGWALNAAIGAKLADPTTDVVVIVGDGAFVFNVPSSTFWVARTYGAPFLTVIENNGGWASPKHSADLVHKNGRAEAADTFWITMTRGSKLPEMAAASGDAAIFRVTEAGALRSTLQAALEIVRAGRSAVVDVVFKPISLQHLP